MPRQNSPDSGPAPADEELEVFSRLADEIRVLRDVLDELREHISYALRNPSPSGHSVVKQMGLDPTSDNWGEQLVIVRSPTPSESGERVAVELLQARDTIRELLGVCELNLDELEKSTRAVIQRARDVLVGQLSNTMVNPVAEHPPTQPPPLTTSPGRLF